MDRSDPGKSRRLRSSRSICGHARSYKGAPVGTPRPAVGNRPGLVRHDGVARTPARGYQEQFEGPITTTITITTSSQQYLLARPGRHSRQVQSQSQTTRTRHGRPPASTPTPRFGGESREGRPTLESTRCDCSTPVGTGRCAEHVRVSRHSGTTFDNE